MVCWAYLRVISWNLLRFLAKTACYFLNCLCFYCGTRCCPCILQLLGCESYSCRSFGIFISGCCTSATCHLWVILFFCCDRRPILLLIYFPHPWVLLLFLVLSHLLAEIYSTKPYYKRIDCSLIRDVFDRIFDYTPALYIWAEWLPWFLGASFDLFGWCWPFVGWLKIASKLLGDLIPASDCLATEFT
jgi:hypothetical protein